MIAFSKHYQKTQNLPYPTCYHFPHHEIYHEDTEGNSFLDMKSTPKKQTPTLSDELHHGQNLTCMIEVIVEDFMIRATVG